MTSKNVWMLNRANLIAEVALYRGTSKHNAADLERPSHCRNQRQARDIQNFHMRLHVVYAQGRRTL